MARSTSTRRGLLLVALLLVALVVVMDLLRRDSFLARAWQQMTPEPRTPLEEPLERLRRNRGEAIRR